MKNLLADAVQSGLFDADWYQSFYKVSFPSDLDAFIDCMCKSKYSPVSPSPNFDTVSYYENYPDVYHHSEFSALEHYLRFGKNEGKSCFPLRPLWTPKLVLTVQELKLPRKGKYAIVLHIFYPDFLWKFFHCLEGVDFQFDLFITTTEQEVFHVAENIFSSNTHVNKIKIKLVPNCGRNFGGFLVEFGRQLLDYDFFCHLHSKKSLYSGREQIQWASYLIEFLINDKKIVSRALSIMESDQSCGLYYPTTFWSMPNWVNHWLKNKHQWLEYLTKNQMVTDKDDFFPYPVGGMFWARSAALTSLLERDWTYADFPAEPLPTDGTFLHLLERLIPKIAKNAGYDQFFYNPATGDFTKDSSWIFDGYRYGYTRLKNVLPKFEIISFDIFDTLVKRDYYEPDYAKYLLPSRLGLKISGNDFVNARNKAEFQIRQEKEYVGDVNIFEIYNRLVSNLQLSFDPVVLAKAEFEIDLEMLNPKEIMIDILHEMEKQGKLIYIISDTYYLEYQIRKLLFKVGIRCKYELFISSSMNARKDNSTMWDMINNHLMKINKKPMFIHIGDNVISDSQIPGDYGIATCHILSPLDKWQAGEFPRIKDIFSLENPENILKWGPLISQVGNNPFF